MAERKKTPNILADLLGDKTPPPSAPAEHEIAVKTLKRQDALAVKQQSVLDANPQDVLAVRQQNGKMVVQIDSQKTLMPDQEEGASEENESELAAKVKVTFYLSEESVDLLEEAQRQLRRLGRGAGKTQSKAATSKSALLEQALKLACADLDAQGLESPLARILF